MRRILLVAAACLAAGCGSSEATDTRSETAATGSRPPVALVPMPAEAFRRCRSSPLVGPACPELIPDSRWRDRPGWEGRQGSFPWGRGPFELNAGAEHPGHPRQDRPPRFVHLVVLGGREAAGFEFEWPLPEDAEPSRDGLYSEPRSAAVALGRVAWGGRMGELALAPSFELSGGIVGNHVIFRWRDGGSTYAVTLHGWEPFSEVVPTLKAVAESVPDS